MSRLRLLAGAGRADLQAIGPLPLRTRRDTRGRGCGSWAKRKSRAPAGGRSALRCRSCVAPAFITAWASPCHARAPSYAPFGGRSPRGRRQPPEPRSDAKAWLSPRRPTCARSAHCGEDCPRSEMLVLEEGRVAGSRRDRSDAAGSPIAVTTPGLLLRWTARRVVERRGVDSS